MGCRGRGEGAAPDRHSFSASRGIEEGVKAGLPVAHRQPFSREVFKDPKGVSSPAQGWTGQLGRAHRHWDVRQIPSLQCQEMGLSQSALLGPQTDQRDWRGWPRGIYRGDRLAEAWSFGRQQNGLAG